MLDSVCPPSIKGVVAGIERLDSCEVLLVRASEFLEIDVGFLERDGDSIFKIVGAKGTFERHWLDHELVIGLPVAVWIRPAWAHVSILYGKPVVWR